MVEVLWFQGNTLKVKINFRLPDRTPDCSLEVKISSDLTGNVSQRLITCSDSKFWTTDVMTGILNKQTESNHSLEDTSLNCSRQSISGYHQIEWQANLQTSQSAALTAHPGPPFDKMVVLLICACTDCSGFNDRHVVTYLVKSKLQILLKCRNQTITCKLIKPV